MSSNPTSIYLPGGIEDRTVHPHEKPSLFGRLGRLDDGEGGFDLVQTRRGPTSVRCSASNSSMVPQS